MLQGVCVFSAGRGGGGGGVGGVSKSPLSNAVFKPQENRWTLYTLGTAAPPSPLTGTHFVKPGARSLQSVVHTARHQCDAAGVRVTGYEWWCLGLKPRASAHLASSLPLSHIVAPRDLFFKWSLEGR